MLAVRDLIVDIEGSRVLRGISFEVKEGELVCLVGRNGAGKTTTFRSIMGFRRAVSGSIMFPGQQPARFAAISDRPQGDRFCAGGERSVWRTDGCRKHRHADLDPCSTSGPRQSASLKPTRSSRTCGVT